MSYLPVFLTLAAIWAVIVISPGPCFVATVQKATRGSSRDGVFVALGIATGTIIWCAGSLLGRAVLFATFSWLYQLVRLAGAAYLMYLGLKTIRHAHQPLPLARKPAAHVYRRAKRWIDYITGGLYMLLGGRLALAR